MIRTGQIVNILGDAGNGRYGAKYVDIIFSNTDNAIKAYAKQLGDTDILIEIIAALLGREMGLPIPEPALGFYQQDETPWFVSIDIKVPDLSQHMDINIHKALAETSNNLKILETLCAWPHICTAIGFDEWIANGDRNTGNILYDGKNTFYLIDHNRAMRLPFYPQEPITNQLLAIKLHFTHDELGKQRIKNHIEKLANTTNPDLPKALINKLKATLGQIDIELLDNIAEFLQNRLNFIVDITAKQVITKQQTL